MENLQNGELSNPKVRIKFEVLHGQSTERGMNQRLQTLRYESKLRSYMESLQNGKLPNPKVRIIFFFL